MTNTRFPLQTGVLGALQLRIVALSLAVAVAAGACGLVYPSPYAPLLPGVVVAAAAALVACLQKPILALYAALFVVFLPLGLISTNLQSNLNRAAAVFAFAVWFLGVVVGRRRVRLSRPAWFMLGFIVWSVVTLAWTDDRAMAWIGIQAYILRFVVYLVLIANLVRTRRDLDGFMGVLALIGWTFVLISLYTVWREGYAPGTRLKVFDANENQIGVLALIALPGVLWQVTRASGSRKAIWSVLAVVYLASAIVLTALSGSRGGAISLLITLAVFVLWKPTRAWSTLALFVLALAGIFLPFAFSTTLARFLATGDGTLLGGREALWQAAWQVIQHHPWLGVGVRNSQYAIIPYLIMFRSVAQLDSAPLHNPVLTVWADGGLTGLLLYLAVLASAVWLFLREFVSARRLGRHWLTPYFALIASVFVGFMASWIKGGGMESDYGYFLLLALLVLPSCLEIGHSADRLGCEKITENSSSRYL